MLLRELAAENFRPFETASVRLPTHGLVLVAGANNAGKSALLSAADVVAGVSVDVQSLRRSGSVSPARVMATFSLSDEERSSLFAASPLLTDVLGEWPGRGLQLFGTTGQSGTAAPFVVKVIRGLLPGEDSIDPLLLMDQGGQAWGVRVPLESAMASQQY